MPEKQEKTLVKEELAVAIHEAHGGISHKEAATYIDIIVDLVREKLVADGKVLLSGFGKFEVLQRKSRKIADPNTRKQLQLPEHHVVKFKPSQAFIDNVNKEEDDKD